jgi:uncharacterized protein (DUF2062 family)
MLFKRRDKAKIAERIITLLWPRRSWGRSTRYVLLRLRRLKSSPHRIAIGCAAGVFASFTPFLGFQMMSAGLIAWALGGSVIASALGTFAGNPLSYPLIWLSTFNLGSLLIGQKANAQAVDLTLRAEALRNSVNSLSVDTAPYLLETLWPLVKPMAVGSLPMGGCAAVFAYFAVRKLVETSQAQRRALLKLRLA